MEQFPSTFQASSVPISHDQSRDQPEFQQNEGVQNYDNHLVQRDFKEEPLLIDQGTSFPARKR